MRRQRVFEIGAVLVACAACACSGTIITVPSEHADAGDIPQPSPLPPTNPTPPEDASVARIADSGANVDATYLDFDAGPALDATATATLYQRFGGHAGITLLVHAIINAQLMDPQQASYFADIGAPQHATRADMEECFTDLVASAIGGSESYPLTLNSGYQCRSMQVAHAGLRIPNGVFNGFMAIVAKVMTQAGVAAQDISTMVGLCSTTKSSIVDPTRPDGGKFER